ncbi:MAG: ribosome maturation factor RimM [Hyphomicrobiales bacterium]|nr:ribosome maturation factor RimM [Hyphomicrobiales bacterium]
MAKLEKPVQMAVIGAAHGIRGEVRIKIFTGDPAALGDYGPLRDAAGRAFEVISMRPAKEVSIVRFKGVATREAAEALNGVALFVDRSALPADLDEEEFYHADLIGLAVRDQKGAEIGTVAAIHDFGAGDILEVARRDGPSVMIPFTRAAVPEIAPGQGFVRIDSLAAGLVEEEPPENAGARSDRERRR